MREPRNRKGSRHLLKENRWNNHILTGRLRPKPQHQFRRDDCELSAHGRGGTILFGVEPRHARVALPFRWQEGMRAPKDWIKHAFAGSRSR